MKMETQEQSAFIRIPKDVPSAALTIYEHMVKVFKSNVKLHKEDEPVIEDVFNLFCDGSFLDAHNILYSLNESQKSLIPPIVLNFLVDYSKKSLENFRDKIHD